VGQGYGPVEVSIAPIRPGALMPASRSRVGLQPAAKSPMNWGVDVTEPWRPNNRPVEKLHRASILLATSDGPLRVRLVRAWERAAGDVLVEHMPKGLGIEWGDLLDEMKAAGPQGDGSEHLCGIRRTDAGREGVGRCAPPHHSRTRLLSAGSSAEAMLTPPHHHEVLLTPLLTTSTIRPSPDATRLYLGGTKVQVRHHAPRSTPRHSRREIDWGSRGREFKSLQPDTKYQFSGGVKPRSCSCHPPVRTW